MNNFKKEICILKNIYKTIKKINANFDKILSVFTTTNTTRVNVNFK